MGVDLRPYIGSYAGQGQTTMSEGAADRWYNCTIECLRRTALDLGFSEPYDDEQLRNDIRSRFGSTGLGWNASVVMAQDRIPGLAPLMSIQNPPDVVAALQSNIAKGYMQHIGLWCDTNAWVPAKGPVTYSHACRVTADTGAGFWFQNPEPHPDFYLSNAQVRALYDGGKVLVFTRSLLPAAKPVNQFTGGNMGLVAFTYRPPAAGPNNYIDLFYVANGSDSAHPANTMVHAWGTDESNLNEQNLGGAFDPAFGASSCWSPDGAYLQVQGVGTGGSPFRNLWMGGKWTGWMEVKAGSKSITPLAPPDGTGPAGPPGTTLTQPQVDAMVKTSLASEGPSLDPKTVAAALEAALKTVTGS